MRQKRLDRVLEECLTAYLEGRRSIEECLSLYPSLSDRLEPLLRAAVFVNDSFQFETPPSYIRERGLQRFLASARSRARARALTRDLALRPRAAPWGSRQWGFLGSAVAAAVGLLFVTGIVLSNGGGGEGQSVFNPSTPAETTQAPSAVRAYAQHVSTLNAKISQGQQVEASELTRLSELAGLIGDPATLDQESVNELSKAVPDALRALGTIAANQPPDNESQELRDALDTSGALAAKIPPEFTPPATGTPGAEPTVTPGVAPTPEPTAAPTPAPATATPQPTPTTTEQARNVDSFSQPLNIDPLATPGAGQ